MRDISFTESLIKLFVALPLVLLIAYSSLKLGNKYMKSMGKSKNLEVVETVQVYNKAAISIVRIMDEYFVLGVSENGIEPIRELSEAESKAIKKAGKSQEVGIAEHLGGFRRRWKAKGGNE